MKRSLSLWRKRLSEFSRDRAGNVVVIFAVSLIPIMGLVGVAVDYSRANSVKVAMQAALDSTGLILAKNPSVATMTNSQLLTAATSSFNALYNRTDATPTIQTASYDSTSSSIAMTANAAVSTDFLGFFRIRNINLTTSSTVTWGMSNLQVALVLDNTGSMGDYNKLTNLKTAAHQLLNQLQSAATNGASVQVAIIPFSTDVNIGTAAASNWWIDWSDWASSGSVENGMTCSSGSGSGWGWGWGWNNGWGSNWGSTTCGGTNHSAWNGCVMDRGDDTTPDAANYDVRNTVPVNGTTASYFPADQSDWCPEQLMPLSNNWTALGTEIDNMVANGNTNQTIGLVWGWHALTPAAPLNAPLPPPNTQQVIILLTDGLNTENRWSSSQSSIDARTALVCTNIKAAGIMVYTVLVMSGDSTILQQCATDPNKYFALTQAGQIITTFNQIGTSLSRLRVAR